MANFKSLFLNAFFIFGFASPALALPVTFTYTSNAVDLSVLEDWEYKMMTYTPYGWETKLPGRQAGVTLEVDCEIGPAGVTCDTASQNAFSPYAASYGLLGAGSQSAPKLVSAQGFTDLSTMIFEFAVDSSGKVIDWLFQGAEYGQVGDFKLSSEGDSWAYAGWTSGDPYTSYCWGVQGVEFNPLTGLCANGVALPDLNKVLSLGTGTWTSSLAYQAPVTSMPLPAGLPILLTGLAILVGLRRRGGRCG